MSLRKEIEQDIYEMLDNADPSGANTERMRALFTSMKTDTEFYRYMDRFFSDPDRNYVVSYKPYENPVTIQFIERLFKQYDIPLYEYLYKPFINEDVEDPPRTVHKHLVVDVPVKRLKQMIFTKNHTVINPTKVDPRTGQVTGSDKVARMTSPELYSMIVQNQFNSAKEIFGPMADDADAAYEMARIIQRDGEVELKDLPDDPINKTSLNTIDYYMLGSCIVTNLLDESGYVLPITMKAKEDTTSTINRA